MKTFDWCVHSESSGSTDYATRSAKFGSGYEQVTQDGINNIQEEWNISISGRGSKIKEIKKFLDEHGGSKSFLWTPPLGELNFYRGNSVALSSQGGDYYTLTANFAQSYLP